MLQNVVHLLCSLSACLACRVLLATALQLLLLLLLLLLSVEVLLSREELLQHCDVDWRRIRHLLRMLLPAKHHLLLLLREVVLDAAKQAFHIHMLLRLLVLSLVHLLWVV